MEEEHRGAPAPTATPTHPPTPLLVWMVPHFSTHLFPDFPSSSKKDLPTFINQPAAFSPNTSSVYYYSTRPKILHSGPNAVNLQLQFEND